MSKTIFFERFNEKCDEFCRDIITSFPNIEQFKHIKTGLNLIKNIDMKTPQRIFHNNIYNTHYRDFILTKNEEFFLTNEDFNIQYSTNDKKQYWDEFIDNIRLIWKTLSNEDKDIVWKYFHILVILSEKCV